MWNDVVRALQTGALAEIAVVAFLVAFVLIVIRVFTMPRRERERRKRLPLDDSYEIGHFEPPDHV